MRAYYDDNNHVVVVDNEKQDVVSTENVKYATGLAMKTAAEHHCHFLLFDITMMKEVQSIEEGVSAMKDVSKTTGLTFEFKCAIVYNPELYSEKRADLIQMVVSHRPNPPFKMFTNKEDAIKWLTEVADYH